MRKEGITAAGSMLFAFLASQHHTVHMLLFSLGLGGAGMGFMTHFPMVRRVMFLISLLMTGVMLYHLWRKQPPRPMRIMGIVSASVSLGLVAWSVYQSGF